jgi:hypothetical protein
MKRSISEKNVNIDYEWKYEDEEEEIGEINNS